ncbi:CLUMA_CG006351, isoform A [Clunio marinus]|uniref:CLUMA_CG006351, isoform A n=1 Tax=Clunio marinus TaxID=568069 RepID=A0A1J1I209_9DIPT|nr:CLUMA_CG006351, isoform A [Clunio marinus]
MFSNITNLLWSSRTFDGRIWKGKDCISAFKVFKCFINTINIFRRDQIYLPYLSPTEQELAKLQPLDEQHLQLISYHHLLEKIFILTSAESRTITLPAP